MAMASIEIKLPALVKDYILEETTEEMRNALLLYPYISDRTISHGKAAEILGIPKYDLIELYDHMGLSYLSMDISEIENEIADWEKLKEAHL